MKWLERLVRVLAGLNRLSLAGCQYLTIGLVASITAVVCAGVFWRYALNDALAWSEETAKFLMVWLVFVAAPIALARGGHAAIDTLPKALPPRMSQALFVLIYVVVILFVIVLIDQGTRFAWNARVQRTPTTGVSMTIVFASMPIGGLLLLLVSMELFFKSIIGILDPARGVHASESAQGAMSPE